MERVHRELEASGAKDRIANFTCVLAYAAPDGKSDDRSKARCFARTLTWPPRGTRGFGYDPIFVPEGYSETFGEMEPSWKNFDLASHLAFEKSDPPPWPPRD